MDLDDSERTRPAAPTTGTAVSQLMLGFMTTQLVRTALQLELPDRLSDGTRTADDLASETATDPASLTRLLRALSGVGLTEEVGPGRFGLTATGTRLRSDVAGSLHAMARVFTDESMTQGWRELTECVRSGQPAFDGIFGAAYYTDLARDPERSRLFHEAHGQSAQRAAESLARGYDFSGAATIVDIGGGDGTLLATILASTPGPSGIVYDTETGIAATADTLHAAGVIDRCEIRAGDFLVDVPAGADLYLLKSTIHNWDDEHAAKILGSCRRAMPAHGRLLLVETVLPPLVESGTPPFAHLSDLNMLVNLGGREHTEAEFRALLADSGFDLVGLRPLPDAGNLGLSVIEAAPA